MRMNIKMLAIGIVVIVAVVGVAAAVGLSLNNGGNEGNRGDGGNGGDTPGTVQQEYWVEIAETADGFSLDVRLTAVTDGYFTVYIGNDVLLSRSNMPVIQIWKAGDQVHLSDTYDLGFGRDYDYIEENLDIRFDVPSNVELVRR